MIYTSKVIYKDPLLTEFSAPVKIRHWVSEAIEGAYYIYLTHKHTQKKRNLKIVMVFLFYLPKFLWTV